MARTMRTAAPPPTAPPITAALDLAGAGDELGLGLVCVVDAEEV